MIETGLAASDKNHINHLADLKLSMESPLVSVLITAFDREKYVEEAIRSVLASTFQDFEIVIVDDCSHDQTFEIAASFVPFDKRVRVYRNENNLGQFANRNKAALYANGTYLKYVDSDDILSKDALQVMVDAIRNDPNTGIGLVCDLVESSQGPYQSLNSRTAFLWHYFNGGILFPGPTGCIYRKDLFFRAGGFPLDLGINGDVYLNMKIASFSRVVLFPGHLVFWRKHSEQVDELQKDYLKMHKERFLLNRRILNEGIPMKSKRQLMHIKLTCKVLFLRGVLLNVLLKGRWEAFLQIMSEAGVSLLELPKSLFPLRFLRPGRKDWK